MYKHKFLKGFVFAFSILFIVSCKKNKNQGIDSLNTSSNTEILNSDTELLKLYSFTTTSLDGGFSLRSWSTFGAQSFSRDNTFRAGFHSPSPLDQLGTLIKGNLVKVGNDVIQPESGGFYEKSWDTNSLVWGNQTEFSFQESTSSDLKKVTFRVPKLLEIEGFNPAYEWNKNLTLSGSLKVKADTENKKGILIYIEYRPSDNPELSKQGYNKLIRNGEIQTDDGTIEMTEKLFANIPKGAEYKINVARINYEIVEMYGKKYGFYAYLELSHGFVNQ